MQYWLRDSELCVELNLPGSSLSTLHSSNRFPTPPSPQDISLRNDFAVGETWYYYLIEISFRCIFDRILETFQTAPVNFQDVFTWWPNTPHAELCRLASDLDQQIYLAAVNLPEYLHYIPESPTDRKLSLFISMRKLALRECLFRPFLFRVVHSPTQHAAVHEYARECVESCPEESRRLLAKHHHHGSWFAGRAALRCGMSLIAAFRAEFTGMPPDWTSAVEHGIHVNEQWAEKEADLKPLAAVPRKNYQACWR